MAAAIPQSTTLIIAASAGGLTFLLIVLAAVYAIVKRQRRRRIDSNRTVKNWRLSRYPGGHLSLTPSEADRNRPPRTPRHIASARSPYGFWEGWKNVGSRDSLSRRSATSGASRGIALSVSYPDLQVISNEVPRSLPAARIRHHASSSLKLTPITERRSRDHSEKQSRSYDRMGELAKSSRHTASTRDPTKSGRRKDHYHIHSQPKHYVGTHRRSVPTGPPQTIQDVLPATDLGHPLGDEIRSTMTRSFSVHRQYSGDAPILRMHSPPPELPREIPRWSRVQALRSHPKDLGARASTVSSASLSSSLYDDDVFGPPARNEVELGSIGLLFEPSNEIPISSSEVRRSWNSQKSQMPGTAVFSDSFELARTKLHLRQRESCASSISRHPLSRNPSSGLAPSLVDQYGSSRSASSASRLDMFSKDTFNSFNTHRILPLCNGDDPSTFTAISTQSSSSKSYLTQLSSRKESPLRVSMSILQETSGNKSSLDEVITARPASDPTAQPFIWDERTEIKPGKPSALKNRDQGHKRQSRQRISFTSSRPSSIAFEAVVEELADNENVASRPQALPGLFFTSPQQDKVSPRPPSILTLETWLKPPSTPGRGRSRVSGDYSEVVSVYESYNTERGASSEDLVSTPTRKPSSVKPYNRRSSIIPGTPSHPLWLLREPFVQNASQPEYLDSPQITIADDKNLSSNVSHAPEKRPVLEGHVMEHRFVRGTWGAPMRRPPTKRSPDRGSPVRSAGRSPTRPLALTVMNQLRKKNSKVFDSDAIYYMNTSPGNPETNDSEGLDLVTPKRSFPKVHRNVDSNVRPIERVWGNMNREDEVVGLGITADFDMSDHLTIPDTIFEQVNHSTGGR